MTTGFSLDEIDRYGRQILLPEWGAAGQERVRVAHVRVSGRGVAAEAAVRYLAGAGVGRLDVSTAALADIARAINPHVTTGSLADDSPAAPLRLVLATPTTSDAISAREDRESVGAACAVEALKAILGLPHRDLVALPSPGDSGSAA